MLLPLIPFSLRRLATVVPLLLAICDKVCPRLIVTELPLDDLDALDALAPRRELRAERRLYLPLRLLYEPRLREKVGTSSLTSTTNRLVNSSLTR